MAWYSENRHIKTRYWKNVLNKISALLEAYIIGTCVYCVFSQKRLELLTVLDRLVHFNASPPYYFVVFYLQLLLVSRFLYQFICKIKKSKYPILFHIVSVIAIMILSALTIKYTFVLPVHGAGQHVLGGTYLLLYYLGMLFFSVKDKIELKRTTSILVAAVLSVLLLFWIAYLFNYGYILDERIKYLGSLNPPGPTLMIYAMLIGFLGWSFHQVFSFFEIQLLHRISNMMGWLGQHTMYIFIFHLLVIYSLESNVIVSNIQSIWIKRLVYLASVIIFPVAIEYLVIMIKRGVKSVNESTEQKN